MPFKVAVIGAGPKAAALSAKAAALNSSWGEKLFELEIFDKHGTAGNWRGVGGYTDGSPRLCSPAEMDVGFPYDEPFLSARATKYVLDRWSWAAFLRKNKRHGGHLDWFLRGRKPPRHSLYGRYVGWVLEESNVQLYVDTVEKLEFDGRAWRVLTARSKDPFSGYDGVVVTGPGPSRWWSGMKLDGDPRILDAQSYWKKPRAEIDDDPSAPPIVIVGGGGSAAAIARDVIRSSSAQVEIICSNPTFLTRGNSYFENMPMYDEEWWDRMGWSNRDQYASHTARAVVWPVVISALSHGRVTVYPGTVKNVVDREGELFVQYDGFRDAERIELEREAQLVVNAIGFDEKWMLNLLPDPLKDWIHAAAKEPVPANGDARPNETRPTKLDMAFARDLSLGAGFPAPGLHLPFVASRRFGPGVANAMALGRLADRILQPYWARAITGTPD